MKIERSHLDTLVSCSVFLQISNQTKCLPKIFLNCVINDRTSKETPSLNKKKTPPFFKLVKKMKWHWSTY